MNSTSTTQGTGAGRPPRLFPPGIAFYMEERPLLWFERPEDYDAFLDAILEQYKPRSATDCIFTKDIVDCVWEFRRMRNLKHTAINFAMPPAAGKLLVTGYGHSAEYITRPAVVAQAADVAYGAEEDLDEGQSSIEEQMEEMRVTPEMIHYKSYLDVMGDLTHITRECERLENRMHSLIKSYEGRQAALVAMARSLVERETAETVDFREAN